MMNVSSQFEDSDVTFGYMKGHNDEPPKPAVVIDSDCYVWDIQSESWEYVQSAFAHQVFFSQKPKGQ